ncbi:hypothetical protein D9M71_325730 [compost metagenome]
MLPSALRIEKTQYAAGAELASLGIDPAVDVLDADPLRSFDAVHQLNRNRRIVEKNHRTDQQLAQQLDDLGHAFGTRRREAPTALEQVAINRRQLSAGEFGYRPHHTPGLFQQAQFAALVVAKLLRQLLGGTSHGQLLGLQPDAGEPPLVQRRQIAPAMAQRRLGIGRGRQDDLGVAQVEQAFLAATLEHVLGQGQVATPGRDRRLDLTTLHPGQVAHRDVGQLRQALDHHGMSCDAAAITLPGFGVSRGVDYRPATLAPALKSVEHQPLCASSVTCGKCQKASRTARSEKRSRKRSSIISAHCRRC